MLIGGAAAATKDVDEAFSQKGADMLGHEGGCLFILAELVGEAGVGIGGDEKTGGAGGRTAGNSVWNRGGRGDRAKSRGGGINGARNRINGARNRGNGARNRINGARNRGNGARNRGNGARIRGGGGKGGGELTQAVQVRKHVLGTEGTVETNAEGGGMENRDKEGFEGLSTEGASGGVTDGDGEHNGDADARGMHGFFGGVNGGFGVEGVEDGLYEEGIHAAFDEGGHLFEVGGGEVVEGDAAEGRVTDVRAHGEGLVGGADGADDEAGSGMTLVKGTLGRTLGNGVQGLAGEAGGSKVDVADEVLAVVVGEGDALGVEGVGLDDVCSGGEVAAVDVQNDVWAGEAEEVIVACLLAGELGEGGVDNGEALAGRGSVDTAEVILGEAVGLDHGAHGTVEDEGPVRGGKGGGKGRWGNH